MCGQVKIYENREFYKWFQLFYLIIWTFMGIKLCFLVFQGHDTVNSKLYMTNRSITHVNLYSNRIIFSDLQNGRISMAEVKNKDEGWIAR